MQHKLLHETNGHRTYLRKVMDAESGLALIRPRG
jgi:hypothetical protein